MNETRHPPLPILVVDDEEQFLLSARTSLALAGLRNVTTSKDSRGAEELLSRERFSCVLLDMYMPHRSGWDLLPLLVQQSPETPVIIITAANDVETAVMCMRSGAFDYITKPVDETRLLTSVRRALEYSETKAENTLLSSRVLSPGLRDPGIFSGIITRSAAMLAIFQYIEAVGATSFPILVTGETGTGKELVARAIHQVSRRPGAFVPVNAAGLDDTLFADALFGHKRGAFTGADRDRGGFVRRADDGTLFLDEIADLPLDSQSKILRLIQEKEFYPLGSTKPESTDTRFVFATNRDLSVLVKENHFRRDLFYRLQSHCILVPPLRDRKEDIPLLVHHFLEETALSLCRKKSSVPAGLMRLLDLYDFPGNIRELQGMIADAVVRSTAGRLSLDHFKAAIGVRAPQPPPPDNSAYFGPQTIVRSPFADMQVLPSLQQSKELLIAEALQRAGNNRTLAAELLGISRQALGNRLRRQKDT